MRPGSITRSTSLRLAGFYMALFLFAYLGANVVAYNLVASYLYERLDSHVLERFREIEAAFAARGLEGATAMIESHGPAIRGEETLYILREANGSVLAGNSDLVAAPGFSTVEVVDHQPTSYRLYRQALGPNDLTVGVSYDDTNRLRSITLTSFGWATAVVLVIGLGGGAILAFKTRRRIAYLSEAMQRVGAGELSRRLPISSGKDDIDALAEEVNVALGQLEASVDAMKQVTTDIAHDLKTPIGRLYLLLESAHDRLATDTDRAMIATAMEEVRMITGTFDALLRISQIEAGARRDRFTIIDVGEIIEGLLEIYGEIAADEGQTLRSVPRRRAEELRVFGDAELLRQMLANLVLNAIRHAPRGSRIDIASFANDGRVCIAIADNGPGIPAVERQNVFNRFYRLEKSRTSQGSGLGLSLVKAIAELHGAVISLADNHPGLLVKVIFPALNGRSRKNPPVEVRHTGG
jgi:signal transduction histidine kinase